MISYKTSRQIESAISRRQVLLSILQIINVGQGPYDPTEPYSELVYASHGPCSVRKYREMLDDKTRVYTIQIDGDRRTLTHVPDCLLEYRKWLEKSGSTVPVYSASIEDLLSTVQPKDYEITEAEEQPPRKRRKADGDLITPFLKSFDAFPDEIRSELRFDVTADVIFGLLSKGTGNVGTLTGCARAHREKGGGSSPGENDSYYSSLMRWLNGICDQTQDENEQLAFDLFDEVIAKNIEWGLPHDFVLAECDPPTDGKDGSSAFRE